MNIPNLKCLTLWIGLSLAVILVNACDSEYSSTYEEEQSRPNVLFISIDDLRNDLGALGVEHAQTPHLDQFANNSRLFSRHYIQVPSCGPSRTALLRGKRPSGEQHLPNSAIRDTHDEWTVQSLPTWFREHGYTTLSLGKITHYPGGLTGSGWAEPPEELPGAWDRIWVPDSPWKTPRDMMHGFANGVPRDKGESPTWEAHDGPDESYPDAWVAKDAVETLDELAGMDEPWFFAVGYFKPHLPFAAPKSWYDIHDPNLIQVSQDTMRHPSPSSWHSSGELMNNYGQHSGHPQNDKEYAQQLRLGYAAATSYVDAQVGRLLERFEELGLDDNTIVVVWSDHGFALGEQGIWGKHSLYEVALKSPVMIRYPGMHQPGENSDAVIETIDIYPTLTDLAGLPTPEGLQGKSLRPQLENPRAPSEKPAFGYFKRGQTTVRTDDYRLIVHRSDGEILGYELFDFREDPEGIRRDPDDERSVVSQLMRHIDSLPWQNPN